MKSKLSLVYISLILAMLFWGYTFVAFKFALESFKPISIIFLRLIISVIFLFILAFSMRKLQKIKRADYKYFIILALFEPFFYFMGESFGLTYVSSTLGSVVIAIIPLIVPIAAYFMYREKLTILNWIGLLVSFAGVIAVVFSSEGEIIARFKGVLLLFLAVLSAVGYSLTVKGLSHKYNGYTITAYQNALGIVLFLPLFLWFDAGTIFSVQPSTNAWISLIYLAIFGSSLTFVLFTFAIREIGASRANIFSNLIPVFTAVFSYFLMKEAMPGLKVAGIFIVLIGVFLSQVKSITFKKAKVPPVNYQFPA
jgi:drug/metabolite transporter (DMT)-like permease